VDARGERIKNNEGVAGTDRDIELPLSAN
jgi:hypothetical protein